MRTVNREYLPKEHSIVGIHSGEAVFFFWEMKWILVDYWGEFHYCHAVLSKVTLKLHHMNPSEI
jgi:hypothetical protein